METLEPWIYGPLELIKHAEEHQQADRDFDRLIALIGYDNAIEVSISTYLQLHPSQRGGVEYQRDHVQQWLTNYHSLLSFFYDEFLKPLTQKPPIAKETIIHYHTLRNDLYHEGKNFVPAERDVQGAHTAALFVFSTLFHVNGAEILKNFSTLHAPATGKFHFQGSGTDLFKVHLDVGAAIFRITYRGRDHHYCSLYDEDDRLISRLFGIYEGRISERTRTQKYSKSANIKKEGVYLLKVTADAGTWDIEIEQ